MKKAFMLVAAIAMLSAPVFAEITVSGDFEIYYEHEFSDDAAAETYEEDNGNSLSLDLGIMIGEYTTINTGLAVSYEETDTDAEYVMLDGWSVTQDITGALGVDGPVSLSVEMGDAGFDGKQYTDELDPVTDDDSDYATEDTNGGIVDFLVTIGLMDMITIELGILPATYADSVMVGEDHDVAGTVAAANQFGFSVYGVFGPASLAAYFVTSDGAQDMELNGLLDFAPVEVGFQLQIVELDTDADLESYLYATYTSDFGLEATVEFWGMTMISDMDIDLAVDAAYAIEVGGATVDANWGLMNLLESGTTEMDMEIGVGVSYPVSDVVELHANYDIESLLGDAAESMVINVGSDLTVGAMSYEINYELGTADSDGGEDMTHTLSVYATVSF